ncbi:endonuclease domain-containing protein [Spongiivirga sp. MCCC 1A20706]|uniref:endonuclease domain-containing protein n=1 Tax=Spongiivirga sp. MCCC 1A20706 TaxID=3160963 RepID=UPI0039774E21
MKNKIIPYRPDLKVKARELRKNSTLAEVLLWEKIKSRAYGVQFHRQVPMLDYLVDFYCHELKLVIEVDGNGHNFKDEYDLTRERRLKLYGVHFLRFTNEQIKKNMFSVELVLKETIENIVNSKKHLSNSSQGEN